MSLYVSVCAGLPPLSHGIFVGVALSLRASLDIGYFLVGVKEMYSNWVKIGGKRREIMWDQKSQHHYVDRRNGQKFTVTGAVGSLGKF